jgi:hypothetical protein
MSSMDSPHRQRPLAGVDQALGEGGARQPTELLDQLRERLTRLDSNHPSARPPDHSEMDVGTATNAVDQAESIISPDEPAGQDDVQEAGPLERSPADQDRRGQETADRDPARTSAGGVNSGDGSSQAGPENISESASEPDPGQFEADPGWGRRLAAGDPYRPWFAGDEPVTPWFAG